MPVRYPCDGRVGEVHGRSHHVVELLWQAVAELLFRAPRGPPLLADIAVPWENLSHRPQFQAAMPCDVVDGPAAGAAQTWRSRGRGCPHPAKPDGPAADGRAVAGALAGKPRRAQNLHAARLCRARAPV